MNRFKFQFYYFYDGPTDYKPLRELKTDAEIAEALTNVVHDLQHMLPDMDADVREVVGEASKENAIVVSVTTMLDEAATMGVVEKCLSGLDLYGNKL